MKERVQKIVFFVLSMIFLFLMFRWAIQARESESPFVRFPDQIETFK